MMSSVQPSIHVADWIILITSLLMTLGIGIYHACSGGRQKTTSEYLLGNRKLKFLPVTISLAASFVSSVAMLGYPAEAYTNGITVILMAFGTLTGAVLAALIFVPVFHPLKPTSVNEYLYNRFQSRFVAVLGTLSSLTGMLLYTSLVFFAPATATESATGFPAWAVILVFSTITVIYTTIGGIKAVIWTDVFQAVLMLTGMFTIAVQAILRVGSLSETLEIVKRWDRLSIRQFDAIKKMYMPNSMNNLHAKQISTFNPDPTIRLTFWSVTIGLGFLEFNRYGIHQAAVQRYCSIPSLKKARLSLLSMTPIAMVKTGLTTISGLAMFAYYTKLGCDPMKGKMLKNANQLVPHFLMDTVNYPGIQGILLASISSASLSSASSALNSSSANVWKDILCSIWPNLSEKWNVVITKLLVVLFGILATGISFLLINLGGTIIQMAITLLSSCGGPTTAMFLLGIFFNFTNWIGASAGGITGFAFALWMGFGSYSIKKQYDYLPTTVANCTNVTNTLMSNFTTIFPTTVTVGNRIIGSTTGPHINSLDRLYSVSYLWIACFSLMVAMVVGVLVSLVSGRMHGKKVKSELLHPWVRGFNQTEETVEETALKLIKTSKRSDC